MKLINGILKNKWLAGIIAFSIIVRIITAFYFGDSVTDLPGTFDQISYQNLALRVLTGHGFSFGETWWPITPANAPTAHWSFLYTLYLDCVYFIFGPHPLVARLIQAILTGILQPYLAYRIGTTLFSKTVGLASAGLTAGYLYFVYYDATLMTEPFFIVFVLAGLYLSLMIVKSIDFYEEKSFFRQNLKKFLLLGLIFGSTILLRQLFLGIVPIIYLWFLWIFRKLKKRWLAIFLLANLSVIAIMILPFSIYNTARFGHFVLLNTNSGYAFFWANHPIYGNRFQPILTTATYQDLIPADLRNLDEAELDQALMRRGLMFVLDDPIRYIALSFSRIPVYFMFWPSQESGLVSNISRVASFGILWPFMLYGSYLAFSNKKFTLSSLISSPTFFLIGFALVYSGIHLLSWALIRYRLPVDAVMLVFAGYALVDIGKKVYSRQRLMKT